MSVSPEPTSFLSDAGPMPDPGYRWYHKVGAVLFAIFCFELGVFLLVFPWLDVWNQNFFATWHRTLQVVWMNPYFRGAISGLGLVNIFVSFIEIVRLRRFASVD